MSRGSLILTGGSAAVAGLSWLLAGSLGLFIAVSTGFAVALLAVGLQLPRNPRRRFRRRREATFANAAFPAYRKIEDTLFWAPVSARHFDHAVRPMLGRLLAVALAERHGIDLASDPDAARAAIGDELWPLVDPSRPQSDDTGAPGVPLPLVLRFVDRLETL